MLPNISMLHCAGLRLGAPEFPEPDTWETFEALLSLCRAKGAELLLIAGNLFEQEWVSQEDVERVARSLGSLPGTSVFVTPADRDPLVQTSVYRLVEWPDNVHIFSSAIAGIECLAGKARVYGCAWAAYQQHDWGFLREFHITAETDRAQIMLLPVSLPESVMRDSGLHYAALGIEDHWSGAIRRSERTFWADCGMLTPRDSGALGSYGVVWGELAAEESRFEF
ncbi:MAG: hypothetical protein LBT32_00805, partial [Peptococcaceae bacterium]|nr:hypothetical protein [Peptococcaceae bacterium]